MPKEQGFGIFFFRIKKIINIIYVSDIQSIANDMSKATKIVVAL